MRQTLNENKPFIKRPLKNASNLSWMVALLMAAVSLAGLFFPALVYATVDLQESYLTNDIVTIMIGLPVLLGSIWFAQRGSLLGLLLWPGALLYVVYNYLVYAFGNPLGWLTFVSLFFVVVSTLAMINLLRNIDSEVVKERLVDTAPRKLAGGVMIIFGALFIFRTISIITAAFTEQTLLPITEVGLAVADVTLSILWMIGGILLLRRKPLGYTTSLGLLFAASTLFMGLLVYFILQPLVADVPFALGDFVVVLLMGLICFVPLGIYIWAIRVSASN